MVQETLGSVFPISIAFVLGEQPNSAKFTGWATQTAAGLEKLSSAIGDLWGENFSSNKLFAHTQRPINIPNLGRFAGPSSMLNPMKQTAQNLEDSFANLTAELNEISLEDEGCVPPLSITEYALSQCTDDFANALYVYDPVVFANLKDSKAEIAAAGDWYVDNYGRIFTYTKTAVKAPGTNTYDADMYPDVYQYAAMNVIPDFNQSSADGLCIVEEIPLEGYLLSLPTITKFQHNDSLGNPLEPGDADCPPANDPAGVQALLPYALTAATGMNLSAGDEIPEGFIQLWDEDESRIVEGLTFKLSDFPGEDDVTYQLRIEGGTLDEGNARYRIITIGTTIAEALSEQIFRYATHSHSGPGQGKPISHADLSHLAIDPAQVDNAIGSGGWGIDINSPPSIIAGNDHPHYLCRYGWKDGVDPGQYDNAMLGTLFMAAVRSDYADYSGSPYNSLAISSNRITFGYSLGPYIMYNATPPSGLYLYSPTNLRTAVTGSLCLYAADAIALYTATDNTTRGTDAISIVAGNTNIHTVGAGGLLLLAGSLQPAHTVTAGEVRIAGDEIGFVRGSGAGQTNMTLDSSGFGVLTALDISLTATDTGELISGQTLTLQSVLGTVEVVAADGVILRTSSDSSTVGADAILVKAGNTANHILGTDSMLLVAGTATTVQSVPAGRIGIHGDEIILNCENGATTLTLGPTSASLSGTATQYDIGKVGSGEVHIWGKVRISDGLTFTIANGPWLQIPTYDWSEGAPSEGADPGANGLLVADPNEGKLYVSCDTGVGPTYWRELA